MSRANNIIGMMEQENMKSAQKMIKRMESKLGRKLSEEEKDNLMKKFANNVSKIKGEKAREEYEEQFIQEQEKEMDKEDDDDEEDDDDSEQDDKSSKSNSKKDQFTKKQFDDEEDEEEESKKKGK